VIKILTRRVVDDPIFVASAGRTPALIGIWILGRTLSRLCCETPPSPRDLADVVTAVLRNVPFTRRVIGRTLSRLCCETSPSPAAPSGPAARRALGVHRPAHAGHRVATDPDVVPNLIDIDPATSP
jgi:hypothetical protein